MSETVKCSKVISTCKYGRCITNEYRYCDYLCKTGHRRGCSPEQCDKYVKKGRKK